MTVEPPPRAIRIAAYAAPLTVAPSSLWRLCALLGVYGEDHPLTHAIRGDGVWVVTLSLGSLALAALTIGLVEPWGLAFPRWAPLVGGRRVPAAVALVPATTGAALGLAGAAYALLNAAFHFVESLDPQQRPFQLVGADAALVAALYAPLLITGLLIAAAAADYARRRLNARSFDPGPHLRVCNAGAAEKEATGGRFTH